MKVILMCTITVNGMIAKDESDPTDWTTKGNKKLFAMETKRAGVVVMGNNTYKLIGRPLPERLNVVMTSNTAGYENIPGELEYVSGKPAAVLADLEKRGFKEVFVIGGSQVNSLFLKSGLVDELWLIVESLVFGRGLGLFTDEAGEAKLSLVSVDLITSDLLFVKYKVI